MIDRRMSSQRAWQDEKYDKLQGFKRRTWKQRRNKIRKELI